MFCRWCLRSNFECGVKVRSRTLQAAENQVIPTDKCRYGEQQNLSIFCADVCTAKYAARKAQRWATVMSTFAGDWNAFRPTIDGFRCRSDALVLEDLIQHCGREEDEMAVPAHWASFCEGLCMTVAERVSIIGGCEESPDDTRRRSADQGERGPKSSLAGIVCAVSKLQRLATVHGGFMIRRRIGDTGPMEGVRVVFCP